MFIFRTSDYRSFTGGKLREPVSVPRLQVVQEETLENEVVTNNTTWYLTFTIQEKRIFGAYDDSQAMLVKDYFAGHSQMANFKLARIRTLMKKVPGNEENAQPILSFLRQVKIYKESFVDRNGPYDNIKEHFQRKGLILVLIEIIKNLELWNKPSVAEELWQAMRLLICCNMIKEIQEKVFDLANGTGALHTWQTRIFNAICDIMDRLEIKTEIGRDKCDRDTIADFTIESIPNEESEEGRDFLYCIFYAQFRFEYNLNIGTDNIFTFKTWSYNT